MMIQALLFLLLLFVSFLNDSTCQCQAMSVHSYGGSSSLAIASHRREYNDTKPVQPWLVSTNDGDDDGDDHCFGIDFGRACSPEAVQKALRDELDKRRRRRRRRRRSHGGGTSKSKSQSKQTQSIQWHPFQGPDGRHGNVSTTKLGGDWVLAQSEQVAINCTAEEVLLAYLSGQLQQRWNQETVLDCTITRMDSSTKNSNNSNINNNKADGDRPLRPVSPIPRRGRIPWKRGAEGVQPKQPAEQPHTSTSSSSYYRQDLVLKSQRIIRRHTGIMRYSQQIVIDRVGVDVDNYSYCVAVRLLDPTSTTTTATTATRCKPFEALSVYVHLQPVVLLEQQLLDHDDDDDASNHNNRGVRIYAAGVMKVNRRVVPNLIVFDASGIAGSMAGKGTLWLAAHFKERYEKRKQNNE